MDEEGEVEIDGLIEGRVIEGMDVEELDVLMPGDGDGEIDIDILMLRLILNEKVCVLDKDELDVWLGEINTEGLFVSDADTDTLTDGEPDGVELVGVDALEEGVSDDDVVTEAVGKEKSDVEGVGEVHVEAAAAIF